LELDNRGRATNKMAIVTSIIYLFSNEEKNAQQSHELNFFLIVYRTFSRKKFVFSELDWQFAS
jgi:hypothetical protein